jgi:hypothetical protein
LRRFSDAEFGLSLRNVFQSIDKNGKDAARFNASMKPPPLHLLSKGGLNRLICDVPMTPGLYWVTLETLRATTLPESVETLLKVTATPNTRALPDAP